MNYFNFLRRLRVAFCTGCLIPVLVASAACSGGSEQAADTGGVQRTTSVATSTTGATTTVEAGPGPEVVAWAKTWRWKFAARLRTAATKFVKKAPSARLPGTAADFALTALVNRLSNCRLPLDTRLSQTPPELRRVRRLSLEACRSAFVGVQKFISGQNKASYAGYVTSESQALENEGISRVKKSVKLLKKAEKAVARIAS
jgi:hypothetical protein